MAGNAAWGETWWKRHRADKQSRKPFVLKPLVGALAKRRDVRHAIEALPVRDSRTAKTSTDRFTYQPLASTKRICSVVGCESPVRCKGVCNHHYRKWRYLAGYRKQPPKVDREVYESRTCTHPGCERKYESAGLCKMHRARKRRADRKAAGLPPINRHQQAKAKRELLQGALRGFFGR